MRTISSYKTVSTQQNIKIFSQYLTKWLSLLKDAVILPLLLSVGRGLVRATRISLLVHEVNVVPPKKRSRRLTIFCRITLAAAIC